MGKSKGQSGFEVVGDEVTDSLDNGGIITSVFGLLGDVDENDVLQARDGHVGRGVEDEEEEVENLFLAKEGSGKASLIIGGGFGDKGKGELGSDEEEEDCPPPPIVFSGKKKPSKVSKGKKGASDAGFLVITSDFELSGDKQNNPSSSVDHSVTASTIETDDATRTQAAEESKNKKKKKKNNKSGRTAQEEDDLDMILAELGECPPTLKQFVAPVSALFPPPLDEKVHLQSEPQDGAGEKEDEEQGIVESAAAKKKKKKQQQKEKKAAAAAGPTADEKQDEVKSEAKGKVSKQGRVVQERLAKIEEAKERKKIEEEEKLRKEEEEQRRQEELERLAEEKKRLKKEKEKEKLLKKKQEGKLLTNKQKEEARRLESMKKHMLANARDGLLLSSGDAPTKRPKYQTKKSKPQSHANGGGAVGPIESIDESVESQCDVPSDVDLIVRGKDGDLQNVQGPKENPAVDEDGVEEEDYDKEWDAKNWDDSDLKLPGKRAFADEESDSELEPAVQEEVKHANRPAKADYHTKSTHEIDILEKPKQQVYGINEASKSDNHLNPKLRSPICCIMGHVDTGKTKLLDCIRGTNVQEGEAGGITQQIGATYFPAENIRDRTKELKADAKLIVPGLLVIDTPGHESFSNLRSRGSGLCDLAILVVDIMHGLEPQTIESLNLLRMRNTEFIVTLNKVDRLYGWKAIRNSPIRQAIMQQSKDVKMEFKSRVTQVVTQFKEQGINSELYYKNKEMGDTVSIVPTSALSGEGIPDLLLLLVRSQKTMIERLTLNSEEVHCTVLEVKITEGLGTTIDVILVNGKLREGKQIVVCGLQGPIVTSIRALYTPQPMRESRIKGIYERHEEIEAAHGIKIAAQGLEHAIAGTGLYVVGPNDDLDSIKETVMEDMKSVMNRIDKSGEGVYVQASTLGSLEALLEFLKSPVVNIPVSGIGLGPVVKKDIVKASVMLEKKKEYATILAFDVRVTPEAKYHADKLGVKIFCADIIYHLFDQFKSYMDNLREEKKREASETAVFPCVLKIIPDAVFNHKDPIVLGVDVLEGIIKVGTPICVPQKEYIVIGEIASVEIDKKPVSVAKKGQTVAIKIEGRNSDEKSKMFGRHFGLEDELVSQISRRSIDILKENYRDELSNEEWRLLIKLKSLFKIP